MEKKGRDPSTAIQLFRTFVQPILTYGLEVILPTSQNLLKLEKNQKKLLKQILSVPISAPDSSIYILSDILPIEAQIDQKSLNLFNNICNQNEENLEKKIARRQLIAKNEDSKSWFIAIKRVLFKYNLQSPILLLNDPPTKHLWKKSVRIAIDRYWKNVLIQKSCTYKSLKYLGTSNFSPGNCHTLLSIGNTSDPTREAVRISVKLKVITDTYILQSHRSRYNLNETPICKLCDIDIEDRSHCLLKCKILQCIRERYLNQIDEFISDFLNFRIRDIPTDDHMQIILNCTVLLSRYINDIHLIQRIEDISRQLIYALHVVRYRTLYIKKR
ncbi:unnamed protein product [Mytilus coruscus]|uniref:Reverse transcriptase zinc-binding domain-containing protein n=1 Tax=Mytilus coruscus TaxID=42192 RepID=A0A6J8ATC8_MYTCO|nr:unnamed protein product [Mytilus coruscus]